MTQSGHHKNIRGVTFLTMPILAINLSQWHRQATPYQKDLAKE
jgi:hypothetical protein